MYAHSVLSTAATVDGRVETICDLQYVSQSPTAYRNTEAIKLDLADLTELAEALPVASAPASSPPNVGVLERYLEAKAHPDQTVDDGWETAELERHGHLERVDGTLFFPVSSAGVGARNLVLLFEFLVERFASLVEKGVRIQGYLRADDLEDDPLESSWKVITSMFESLWAFCKRRLVWMVDNEQRAEEIDDLTRVPTKYATTGKE